MAGHSVLVERAYSDLIMENASALLADITYHGQPLELPYPASHVWGMSLYPLTILVMAEGDLLASAGANASRATAAEARWTMTALVAVKAVQDSADRFLFERSSNLRDLMVARVARLLLDNPRLNMGDYTLGFDERSPMMVVDSSQYWEGSDREEEAVILGAALRWGVESPVIALDPFSAEYAAMILREE